MFMFMSMLLLLLFFGLSVSQYIQVLTYYYFRRSVLILCGHKTHVFLSVHTQCHRTCPSSELIAVIPAAHIPILAAAQYTQHFGFENCSVSMAVPSVTDLLFCRQRAPTQNRMHVDEDAIYFQWSVEINLSPFCSYVSVRDEDALLSTLSVPSNIWFATTS